MGTIIVGIDGSEGAANALRWAMQESASRDTPVTAVMTWGYADQHHVGGGTEFVPGYTEADAAAALESFVVAALGPDVAPAVERRLVNDLSTPGLLEAAQGADLLVLGARGLGGFRGLLLGSVSQACLHHATCPVAVVRELEPREPAHVDRIVVGFDGSPGSQAALDWALDEARARHAAVDVVHAWSAPYLMGYTYTAEFDMTAYEDAARNLLEGALQEANTEDLPAPVNTVLVEGGPASTILEAANGADLVVVGSRGFGGFKGMMLGSVSYHLSRHATCPVVVIPLAG